MVKIRLRRVGKRNQTSYRIVAIEEHLARDGKYIELLGQYNPRQAKLEMDLARVEYWLSKGAQPTNTTRQLIKRYTREHPATAPEVELPATETAVEVKPEEPTV